MKKLATTILACGILLTNLHQASAAAQLRLSDGTPGGTIIIVDGDANDFQSGTTGVIGYAGPVGANWIVNVTVGNSYPAQGSPSSPVMDLGSQNMSQSAGTLTIDWSDNGFTSGGAASISIGGTTAGSVNYQVFADPGNVDFAKTLLVASVGTLTPASSGGAFNGDAVGAVGQLSPYSLTLEAVIQHPGNGVTGFDAGAVVIPPTCSCALTFNSPSKLTNCASDEIPDVVATQNCGSGTNTVPVFSLGAVTNGICPKIITRTNGAIDGCGTLHTFVQTITVNCAADCTITPSVAVATVGGTGYHASVADAGTGAIYVWTVLNGSITAGQGTTNITWSAGADTNSPISIIITITSPAGCLSTCSASVRLTPKPPGTSLGSGDTATIGFWHNKNGQALINSAPNSPALANWLASNFPCMYGSLAGKPNSAVAALFLTDFNVKGQKTYAQVLGGALACYFTSSTLAGNGASKYGFNITPGGTGAKSFNVGSLGTVLGLQNNTSYTVLELLQAANQNCPFNSAVFDALNTIFDGINTTGDIN